MRQAATELPTAEAQDFPGSEAEKQKVSIGHIPIAMSFEDLLGGDDTPGETAEDIIRAVRAWRDTPRKRSLD